MKKVKYVFTFLLMIILIIILGTEVHAENMGIYTVEDGCITRILPEITVADFKKNIEEEAIVKEKTGEIANEDSIIKTGMTAEINGNTYKLSVTGDINGDGTIGITDLVKEQLHILYIERLQGEYEKSADINNNGSCTVTDIVQLNLVKLSIKKITEYVKYNYIIEDDIPSGIPVEEIKPDGDEDGDGLTNEEEETLGTDIYLADTDRDGLTDYYEINESRTDPLKADTDEDGISDGDEVALGLNPLAKISKNDGIADGNRTLTYELYDEKADVNINITGKGNIASTTVDKLTSTQSGEVLDKIYNFNTKGNMNNAAVTIKYSEEELAQKGLTEDNISLYYVNEENYKLEKIESTVDTENNTITANLEHFSMYLIGKDALNYVLDRTHDEWIDTNGDGKIDEIVIANSGFDPKVNGFSFNNFGSNREPGGSCYGMATFSMAYYKDKLALSGKYNKLWSTPDFGYLETNGYDLTDTYFENGGNLYDYKITNESLKCLLEKPSDYYRAIENDVLKINEKYYNLIEKIGTTFSIQEVKDKPYKRRQNALLNLDNEKFEKNVSKDESQLLNAIWSLFILQANDDRTSFLTEPDKAFDELQSNLQNGTPVVLNIGGHGINAIALIQDLDDVNKFKIAVYDNNWSGEIRYINMTRSIYNKIQLDWTAWHNKYQYKFTYDKGQGYEDNVNVSICYPKIEEKQNEGIYVTLYDDGTLAFTATDRVLEGKTVKKQFGNIENKVFTGLAIKDNNPWKGYDITTVDIVDKIKPKNTAYWFDGLQKLERIENLNNLDTCDVEDMNHMFYMCVSLKELDLSNFNTSKVTNMCDMFRNCENLTQLNLNSFDTKNVIDMREMFCNCENLTQLNLNNFDTRNVTGMDGMFCGCENLTQLNLNNFDTKNVIYMHEMFRYCKNLTQLNLNNFDTGNVIYMRGMFEMCRNLTQLNLNNFDTRNVVDMSKMFSCCENLTQLNLNNFDTKNVTEARNVFFCCTKLTIIYVGNNWNMTNAANADSMFDYCGTDHVTPISGGLTSSRNNLNSYYMNMNLREKVA